MNNKIIVCSDMDKARKLGDDFMKKLRSVNQLDSKVDVGDYFTTYVMVDGRKFCFTDEAHSDEYRKVYEAVVHVDTTMEQALAAFDPTPTSFTKGSRFLLGVLGLKSKKEYLKEGDNHE